MYNDKLRLFFKEKGLKQYEIGKILGYSPAMIGRYLTGSDKINADFILKMVKEFPDVDLQYIFSDKEESDTYPKPNGISGLKADTIDQELEIITGKLVEIRKILAQNCHKN